jgi:hypothetical protein
MMQSRHEQVHQKVAGLLEEYLKQWVSCISCTITAPAIQFLPLVGTISWLTSMYNMVWCIIKYDNSTGVAILNTELLPD